ncbi:ribonuclease H protein [Canna indica]|uniref:Ribonuclease H protein n=1 Tax=Canna indica TaxID=4628 RepID=A0AAQ3JSR9_9LILI|nr:ribonuclease H protein [Canna indica]
MIPPRRPPPKTHDHILASIDSKLSNRKTSLLSQAGKIVMINSVLNSIPTYSLSVTWINSDISNEIESRIRHFLWSHSPNKRGMNLINWDTITLPKDRDGGGGGGGKLNNVIIETDCKLIVDSINNNMDQIPSLDNLYSNIKTLLVSFSNVIISYISRDQNKAAH